jgi:phage tail sheath gpL-like
MAGSANITITGLTNVTDDFGEVAGDAQRQIQKLRNLLDKISVGPIETVSILVSTGAAAAVRASGTVTLEAGVATGDIVTTVGVTAKTVTYATSVTATAAAIAAAINADTTINKFASATSAAGVVTITAHTPGQIGNGIAFSVTGTGATASGSGTLTGGTGPGGAPTTYTF